MSRRIEMTHDEYAAIQERLAVANSLLDHLQMALGVRKREDMVEACDQLKRAARKPSPKRRARTIGCYIAGSDPAKPVTLEMVDERRPPAPPPAKGEKYAGEHEKA